LVLNPIAVSLNEDLDPTVQISGLYWLGRYGGHNYLVTPRAMTWAEAQAYAQSTGGHLVTINDSDENEWVRQQLAVPLGTVWLGLNDTEQEGTFVWSSGEAVGFSRWTSGQPNNSGDAVSLNGEGMWDDVNEGGTGYGVVEISSAVTSDADGDGWADAIDPYRTDPLNGMELRAAGSDEQFGTEDDVVYLLNRTAGARSFTLRVEDGPLQPGAYRFTVSAVLVDRFGNQLDGNGDGVGGDNLVRAFTVALRDGYVLEDRDNNSPPSATPLLMSEDPVGSGFWTSQIGMGAIDPAGESDYWSFEAQEGDLLVINVEAGTLAYPQFVVTNEAGQTVVNSASWGAGFGTPPKATNQVVRLQTGGTHYVQMRNYHGGDYTGSYQFRVDLGRGVQLEPHDWNFYNDNLNQAANYPLSFEAGSAGHLIGKVAGSVYSQDARDYYRLGRLDPGAQSPAQVPSRHGPGEKEWPLAFVVGIGPARLHLALPGRL
jgi:hypothetical protein